jgi:hypothetical protein
MSAWEREHGELPAPNLPSFGRKTGRGLFVFGWRLRLPAPNLNLNRNLYRRIRIKITIKIWNGKISEKKELALSLNLPKSLRRIISHHCKSLTSKIYGPYF